MPVLLVIVGLVILAITIYVALGRGGELSAERADYAPLDLGPVSAADVALLRPPSNGWGYNKQATDEALDRIAESVRERDVRIVALEQLVTDLSRDPEPVALGEPIAGARHRRAAEPPASPPWAEAASSPEPEEEAVQDSESAPEDPARTTLPQPALPPGVWPTSAAPGAARSPATASDAGAEETTQPQPAIRQQQPPPERSHG